MFTRYTHRAAAVLLCMAVMIFVSTILVQALPIADDERNSVSQVDSAVTAATVAPSIVEERVSTFEHVCA